MSPELQYLLKLIQATPEDVTHSFRLPGVVGLCFNRPAHASKLTQALREVVRPIGQADVIEIWVTSWGRVRRFSRFERTYYLPQPER